MKATLVFKTPNEGHFFFGYYDKLQLSKNNTKLLALKVDFIDHVPHKQDNAIIGYFDLTNNEQPFITLAETSAFNWQQGCMLQWLGEDYNSTIIYNDLIEGVFVSVILNIDNRKKTILKRAVYSVHPNGKFAVCIDFERHHWCRRGYAYDGIYKKEKNKNVVDGDAIWLLDIKKNTSKKIVLLDDMMSYKPLSNMENGIHYLEHLMFNPTGDRFCFLHRWKIADGGIYARLYSANMDGSEIYLINDSGRMSHFGWQDDRHLLAYGGLENRVNTLRKHKNLVKYFIKPLLPLYHKLVSDNSKLSKVITGDSYIIFVDKEKTVQRVALEISDEDGHPSFSSVNPHLFMTDTYPDPNEGSIGKLMVYDLTENKHTVLDKLKSIKEYDDTPIRCDLHPRWSYDGQFVSIDTMNEGVRSIYLYKLDK